VINKTKKVRADHFGRVTPCEGAEGGDISEGILIFWCHGYRTVLEGNSNVAWRDVRKRMIRRRNTRKTRREINTRDDLTKRR
jgi:hypothetical protein